MNVFCIYIYVFNYLEVSEIIFLYTPVENVSSTLFLENICRGKITPHFQKNISNAYKNCDKNESPPHQISDNSECF